jgi:hypothetical protein
VSPVKYELGFYILEEDILHSHRSENLKSYHSSEFTGALLQLLLKRYPPSLSCSGVWTSFPVQPEQTRLTALRTAN